MRLEIEDKDLEKMKQFYEEYKNEDKVKERFRYNVKEKSIDFSEETFWWRMVGCLLTTQQKSGSGSPVEKFMEQKPFPLSLEKCRNNKDNLTAYTEEKLKNSETKGRLRFRIGDFLGSNLDKLDSCGGWEKIAEYAEKLSEIRNAEPRFDNITLEREAVNYICDCSEFKGFGPKQSRHLWQALGYTRYEIPIDSRAVNWFNENEIFPICLSKRGLSDKEYYEAVLDIIQDICRKICILPCCFDAALFHYSNSSKKKNRTDK